MIRWTYGERLSECGTFEVRSEMVGGLEVVAVCGEVELSLGGTTGSFDDAHVIAERWLRRLVAEAVCERGE